MRMKLFVAAALLVPAAIACSSSEPGATTSVSPSASAPAAAATVDMLTSPLAYKPDVVNIKVGETVLWRNVESAPHSVTSTNDSWKDSGLIVKDGTFTHTFDAAGTFEYKCTAHPTMTGKVVVA